MMAEACDLLPLVDVFFCLRDDRVISSFPRIDVPAGPDLRSSSGSSPFSCQDTGKIVGVHQICLLLSSVPTGSPEILLLILCKDQALTPSTFAASFALTGLPVGMAWNRLWDTIAVSAMIPLHVLLEMQLEFASGIGRA